LFISPAVQFPTVSVLIKEGEQASEEVAEFATVRFVWWHAGREPKAAGAASSTPTFGYGTQEA